jgi:hypothetical protein
VPTFQGTTEAALIERAALLRLILRGMRQRTFVILNPYVIPRVDPAVARHASEKMISLTDAKPIGPLAEHRPAWSRFFE